MAKLLKKHFGLGSKKANSGSQRSEYSAQKSSSAQDLIPHNLTRSHQSGVVLSPSSHHELSDTHSLKSVASDTGGGCGGHSAVTRTHEHGGCCKHPGCCRHQCSAAVCQRSSTTNELGCRSAIHSGSVAEDSDVVDETTSDGTDIAEITLPNSELTPGPPPVLDEYCDPVDLKKYPGTSDDVDLRGVYVPNHSLDDDYSVPYEVKKIMSDAKLMERFPENESDSKSGKPVNFDEPHEWLAVLSSSDQQQSRQCASNQQTPRMTPKKMVRPSNTNAEQDCGKISPSRFADDEIQTAVGDGRMPPANSFQLNDELAEDNIVASVVVDVNNEGVQLTDGDGNDLSGMMVSLSVELESIDDETVRQESVAAKTSAGGQRCKTSTVNHMNCALKHVHTRTLSCKTDAVVGDADASIAMTTSSSASVKETIDTDIALEQQGWYHGAVGRLDAEDLLTQQPEGSFLVRQSESNRDDFSLSLKSSGGVLHMKIVRHNSSYILGQFSQPFDSVPEMVQFFSQGKLPIRGTDEICLVHPVICSKQ